MWRRAASSALHYFVIKYLCKHRQLLGISCIHDSYSSQQDGFESQVLRVYTFAPH